MVDLNKYQGLWYEVARKPFIWQLPNSYNVTAEYKLVNGILQITNKEHLDFQIPGFSFPPDLPRIKLDKVDLDFERSAYGSGVPVSDNTLLVSFNFGFFETPKSEYIIVDLGKNYEYSVVSNKNKTNLWILSRTKVLPGLEIIIQKLKCQGYNVDDLIRTKQT